MPDVARPLSLIRDVAELKRKLNQIRVTAGFDPNEAPVIIGSGATAGGGSTPSNPTLGPTGAVTIGESSSVADETDLAVGGFAEVDGTRSTAVGYNSNTWNDLTSAFGYGSFCDDFANGTALGAFTAVRAFEGTAVGYSAQANYDNSTAIGANTQTAKAHQIMLGTVDEFVEIRGAGLVLYDTATSTRYLVQITSGALVLNTAP